MVCGEPGARGLASRELAGLDFGSLSPIPKSEGSGVPKPPQNSLAGIAEGFMTDLRSLGRCLNSLTR